MSKISTPRPLFRKTTMAAIMALGLAWPVSSIAQETAKELTPEQIQASLAELINTLPKDKESVADNQSANSTSESYDQKPEIMASESTADGIIARLESSIESLSDRKLDRDEGRQLLQLKAELKVARTIALQLNRTKLARDKGRKPKKSPEDSFVITTIEVPPNSTVADVSFLVMKGELENTDTLFDYLKSAPNGGFRDYRIVSRHSESSSATNALATTRQEYDLYKEREKQMLAYIAARNKQLAAVKASRRC